MPAVRAALAADGVEVVAGTPDEVERLLHAEARACASDCRRDVRRAARASLRAIAPTCPRWCRRARR
jgi:hypothetical protein